MSGKGDGGDQDAVSRAALRTRLFKADVPCLGAPERFEGSASTTGSASGEALYDSSALPEEILDDSALPLALWWLWWLWWREGSVTARAERKVRKSLSPGWKRSAD